MPGIVMPSLLPRVNGHEGEKRKLLGWCDLENRKSLPWFLGHTVGPSHQLLNCLPMGLLLHEEITGLWLLKSNLALKQRHVLSFRQSHNLRPLNHYKAMVSKVTLFYGSVSSSTDGTNIFSVLSNYR